MSYHYLHFNPLSADPIKWSNTLKQFVGKLPTNCLSVFDHFVGLALKGLKYANANMVLLHVKTIKVCFCQTYLYELTLNLCYKNPYWFEALLEATQKVRRKYCTTPLIIS